MREKFLILVFGIILISSVYAMSDTAVFQGQYYNGTEFQTGIYEFKFDVYTGEIFGDLIDSHIKTVTTGNWGEWRVELDGLSENCNDTSKDYFMEITIDGNIQSPRRRLTHFNYMRKDVDETTSGDLTISSILKFLSGGFVNELVDRFVFNKGVDVQGNLEVTGTIKSDNKLVCLEDGTNCAGGGGGTSYVSFISTVDGDLGKNDRYLALGTDAGISASSGEISWIIDRDMTITGILWGSVSNSRTKTSAITLMSGNDKNNLVATSLSKDIQGVVSGSDLTFNVALSQGDAAVIKYESGGKGGDLEDLSVTLIGTYD